MASGGNRHARLSHEQGLTLVVAALDTARVPKLFKLPGGGRQRLSLSAVPRALRSDLPDGIYHVTTRGVDSTAIFVDDDDRRTFLVRLNDVVSRFDWCCHALCLMDTHYHLVIETTRVSLSLGLKRLNGLYAQGFNERHARTGHLFGDRFWASLIDSEQHLLAACWYVVCNPVRAGLCHDPGDWPWSRSRFAVNS